MRMQSEKEIKQYYKKQAEKFGTGERSTISDANTRRLEIDALLKYIEDNKKVLEVGCGNGYVAKVIAEKKKVNLTAVDFSEDLIAVAKKQQVNPAKGKVVFKIGSALKLDFPDQAFDVVFTERCLINLITWENQKKALLEIYKVLKSGGIFIMLEAFTDGWENINKARQEVGLDPIKPSGHNLFFEKSKLFKFLEGKFDLCQEDNFLSSYHFGSRILYPALLKLTTKKEPGYDSEFNNFFAHLPPYGRHSATQILVFRKK